MFWIFSIGKSYFADNAAQWAVQYIHPAARDAIYGISTKVLTERLRLLESIGIIYRHYEPTIPPQVTYGLTDRGKEFFEVLDQLYDLALRWYGSEEELSIWRREI